jgi:hypothetical protein
MKLGWHREHGNSDQLETIHDCSSTWEFLEDQILLLSYGCTRSDWAAPSSQNVYMFAGVALQHLLEVIVDFGAVIQLLPKERSWKELFISW